MTVPVWLSWSSGKDSAFALHRLLADPRYRVTGLLTTVNRRRRRVAMHGVRGAVLRAQARAAGLPLHAVALPEPCTNAEYERAMAGALQAACAAGVAAVAFGDLFLADIRAYRERQLAGTGIEPLFPLWGEPTAALAQTMLATGLRAYLTCVDTRVLPARFAGRAWDEALLAELPSGVDPCGENGEFHTCCYAGPMYASSLRIRPGHVVVRDGYAYADLTLARGA